MCFSARVPDGVDEKKGLIFKEQHGKLDYMCRFDPVRLIIA